MTQSPHAPGQVSAIPKPDSRCLLFAMQTSEISPLTYKTLQIVALHCSSILSLEVRSGTSNKFDPRKKSTAHPFEALRI